MLSGSVAYLLDCALPSWDTPYDFHLRLCRELKGRGVAPILTFSEDLTAGDRDRFESAGAKVFTLNYGKGWYGYYRQLGNLVRQYSTSLVHIRFFNYFSAIPWLARLQGVRQIVFTEANSGEWRAKSWKAAAVRLRARAACLPVTRLIAISEFIRRRLMNVGIDDRRIEVIYNGVDTERFTPDPSARGRLVRQFSIAPGELIVATVLRLLPWKQPQVLVEACALLAKRGVPVRLLVAGDGVLRGSLESLAQQLGITDRTHFLGHFHRPERILQGCDIFVLPSIGEAFGNVLAEAMACGVPVVGSRSGAIGEIIVDGENGLLAEPLSPASFAGAIQQLAENPVARLDMGAKGLERVRQHFSVGLAVRRTVDLYESLGNR